MKTTFKLVVIHAAVISCFAACAVKKSEGTSSKKQDQTQVQDKTLTCVGGQPGSIEVQGAVTTTGPDGKSILDTRLKILPQAGLSVDGNRVEVKSDAQGKVGALPSTLDMLKVETDRSYVNLGCGSLGAAIEGLTEIKLSDAKDISYTRAFRIFVCGKVDLPAGRTTLTADTIYMENATVTMTENNPGTLVIQTNSIGVKGHNVIQVKGKSAGEVKSATPAALNIVVAKSITGDEGDLDIASVGSDCGSDTAPAAVDKGDEEKSEADQQKAPEIDISTEAMPVAL